MAQRIVHFLLHVPKCAGTTVEAHFAHHLGERFFWAPRWEHVWRNVVGNRYPSLSEQALSDVAVVSGHSLSTGIRRLFPNAEIRESVLLRDPLGYLLSFYNYRWTRYREGWGGEPPNFERWYAGQRRNPISRFLLNRYFEEGVPALYRLSSSARLAYLEERLAGFHFVGSYRRATEMIAEVSRELGLPQDVADANVTTVKKLGADDLSEGLRERVAADNALDQALFDRWGDRGWEGAPETPAPSLSGVDQLRYLIGDTASVAVRKLTG